MINITSIRIKKSNKPDSNVLGVASVMIDECVVIHDIKLMMMKGKRTICFPSKKIKKVSMANGEYTERFEYTDIVHPSTSECREYLETEIFQLYDMEVNKENEQSN